MTNFDFLLSVPDFGTFAECLGNVSLGENEVDTRKRVVAKLEEILPLCERLK